MDGAVPLLPVPVVLQRISAQLDDLASETHRIEHALGDEIGSTVAQDSNNIMRLQRLDFLRQSLEDLALLTLFLANDCEGVAQPGLGKKLRLDATRQLLDPERRSGPDQTSDDTLGDVDFF